MNPIASTPTRVGGRTAGGAADEVALDAVGERLQEVRDGAMRGAHSHGLPISAIARMMKMSIQRVSQIIDS